MGVGCFLRPNLLTDVSRLSVGTQHILLFHYPNGAVDRKLCAIRQQADREVRPLPCDQEVVRSSRRKILPVTVLGSSSTSTTERGYLYAAIRCLQ